MPSRSALVLAAALVPACAASRPPVVVAIVVDQLAAWEADERLPLLPDDGGFARLRREGTWYRKLRYAHAQTDTAVGHTALYTGATPNASGVWIDEWLAADGTRRSVFADAETRELAAGGGAGEASNSARALLLPTVADRLRAERAGATIVSLSMKDRAAIPGGGRRPDVVLWYSSARRSFVTSSAFAAGLPPWAAAIAGPEALAARPTVWTPLAPAWIAAHAGAADDRPEEIDLAGFGTTFPHDVARSQLAGLAFAHAPVADEVVIDLALAALPPPGAPFLLALSLSAHDNVGHLFGPDSLESWDCLYRVDAQLARLFGALDRRYGARGWAALLAADHGITRRAARRLNARQLAAILDEAAVRESVPGPGC